MGAPLAKAFLPLGGQPMLVHSLRTISQADGVTSIVLVVAADEIQRATQVVATSTPWQVPIELTPGGTERQDSVAAGLAAIPRASDLVLVHDAARPFVSTTCVNACVAAAQATGAAIVAVPANDTVKVVGEEGTIARTLDRRTIWLAQTPQVFRTPLLREAYNRARRDGYAATDDAALVERLGVPVRIIEGDARNRKITTAEDLSWAEWVLRTQRASTPTPR